MSATSVIQSRTDSVMEIQLTKIQKLVWLIANILSQINHAWRVGWRDGAGMRPGALPSYMHSNCNKPNCEYTMGWKDPRKGPPYVG